MMRWVLSACVLVLCSCGAATGRTEGARLAGRDHPPPAPAELIVTDLAEGLRVHTLVAPESAAGVTSHILETSGHLLVIDTQLLTPHSEQLHAVAMDLGKPIERVVVTHGHPDHYFGLAYFSDYPSYALAESRRHIEARHRGHLNMHREMDGPYAPTTVGFPQHDLEEGVLRIDEVEIQVTVERNAEDLAQVVLSIPAANAVFLQDMVSNGYHAFTGTGPVEPWIESLERFAAQSPDHVFCGHGPPGNASVLADMLTYLRFSSENNREAQTEEALIDALRERFPDLDGIFLAEVTALIVFRDRTRRR